MLRPYHQLGPYHQHNYDRDPLTHRADRELSIHRV